MFCTFCSSPSNTNTTVKSAGCTILTINAVHLRVAQSKRSFVTHCLASHPNENSCWLSIKVMRSFHANRKQNTCRLSLRSVIKVRHPVFVSLATFLTVLDDLYLSGIYTFYLTLFIIESKRQRSNVRFCL